MAKNTDKIVIKSIDEIVPYVNNPRNNKDAVELVAASIAEFGFKNPIILDKKNVIVAGHTRFAAAKKLGMSEVPCIMADDLTEQQIKAFRLADNKVAEAATWNDELLKIELAGITGIDMAGFGFDLDLALGDEEQDPDEVIEDDAPEKPAEPISKPGDIYRLGEHRLMCGDSTKAEDFAALMDGARADLVVTDPPYNVAIGDKYTELSKVTKCGRPTENIAGDKGMTDEECGQTLWKPAFFNLLNNANDKCSIYCFMPQGGTHMVMMMALRDAGWQVKHELIWVKNHAVFSMGRLDYDYKHEPILYGWGKGHNFYGKEYNTSVFEDQARDFNKMKKDDLVKLLEAVFSDDRPVSVFREDKPQKSDLHPTMKPVKLIARLISNSSRSGEIVVDAFGGSGTTLIACEQMNRRCYMMELDPKYCDVIIQRWENLTGRKAEKIN